MSKKHVAARAAAAIKNDAPAQELLAIQGELRARLEEVTVQLRQTDSQIEKAKSEADLDELRRIRESHSILQDEESVLRSQGAGLVNAIKIARGKEAAEAVGDHAQALRKASDDAVTGARLLDEAKQTAMKVVQARRWAREAGEQLEFDTELVRELVNGLDFDNEDHRRNLAADLGVHIPPQRYRHGRPV